MIRLFRLISCSAKDCYEGCQQWEDKVADDEAEHAAHTCPNFTSHSGTTQLIEHGEWIQTQLESSNGRWEIRLNIWIASS